jgi:glycosyltransferase involved in cell wall biosynthesis
MRVAYVVPRYGVEVRGGAELGARMLAERLAARAGWSAEVFTTTALEATTWANAYPPGTVDLAGVTVHRFDSISGRDRGFDRFSGPVLARPHAASPADEQRWIDLQGPVCPDAVAAAAESAADVVVFYPYLYHPTVRGVPAARAAGKAVVQHPAAHDEPPLRLPLFRDVFAATHGFVFQTWSERRLVQHLFPVAHRRQIVMGLGVEPWPADPAAVPAAVGERPYLLCLGRVDDGKGTSVLARFFAAYKERHPGPLALVYAGPVVHPVPPHPDIVVLGEVDEPAKWALLGGARALVNPSGYEAFSLVVIEAWFAGTPVVVNAGCAATREHCERSGGGLWFAGYGEFEAVIQRLTADEALRAELVRRGRGYAEANFRWPRIIDRYQAFLGGVAEHA